MGCLKSVNGNLFGSLDILKWKTKKLSGIIYNAKLCRAPGSNLGHLDLESNALRTERSRLLRDTPTRFFTKIVSSFKPAWAADQCFKMFSILVKFSPSYTSYTNFSGYHTAQSPSPCSIILRRVNLPTVTYYAESISLQYHTAQSHVTFQYLI